jgi:hypothetical protein
LGLQELACLATTSRWLKDSILQALRAGSRQQLLRTLKETAATAAVAAVDPAPHRSLQHEPHVVIRAVHWLMQMAPDKAAEALAAEDVSARMVWIPAVKYRDAEHLLRAGVRIRYEPLLDAAKNMVPGVEVWVRAQRQLGIQTDIPAAAVAICRGSNWVSSLNTTQLLMRENSKLHHRIRFLAVFGCMLCYTL